MVEPPAALQVALTQEAQHNGRSINLQNPTMADDNPMKHPEEQPSGSEGSPRFGRLLVVLALAIGVIVLIVAISEATLGRG